MNFFVDEYLNYLELEKHVSPNTFASYKRDIEKFHEYLISQNLSGADAINRTIILSFLHHIHKKGLSTSSISRCLASIRSYCHFLVEKKYIESNPTSNLKGLKPEKRLPQILSLQEVEILLNLPHCTNFKGYRDRAMLETLYATGMRVSELLNLRLSDINLDVGYINCHHRGQVRVIPIYSIARNAIRSYVDRTRAQLPNIQDKEILFLNSNGKQLTRQGFWKIIKNYATQAGIKKEITPHTLRHSFAIHLLENGADLKSIQEILGHIDISSTKMYAQIVKNKLLDVYDSAHPRAKLK